jgi:zinc transporter
MASRQTAETNRRLMLLSIVSVLLLPPTLITGLFGMNVDGLPFKDNPHAFHLTILVMVIASGALLLLLRRLRMI